MSAWIVSKTHIDLLITAALDWGLVPPEGADEAGRMLWSECQKSVAFRYPNDKDGEWPGPIDFTLADLEDYTFEAIEGRVDPEVIRIAARSLEFQSCEHPGWKSSQAHKLSRRLRFTAEAALGRYRQRWGEAPESELGHGREGAWSADSRTILLHAEKLREAGRSGGAMSGPRITKQQVLAEAGTISCDPASSASIVAAVRSASMAEIQSLAAAAYEDGLRGGIAQEVAVRLAMDAGVEW